MLLHENVYEMGTDEEAVKIVATKIARLGHTLKSLRKYVFYFFLFLSVSFYSIAWPFVRQNNDAANN